MCVLSVCLSVCGRGEEMGRSLGDWVGQVRIVWKGGRNALPWTGSFPPLLLIFFIIIIFFFFLSPLFSLSLSHDAHSRGYTGHAR